MFFAWNCIHLVSHFYLYSLFFWWSLPIFGHFYILWIIWLKHCIQHEYCIFSSKLQINPFNGANSNCSWELFHSNAPTNNGCMSKVRSLKLKNLSYLLSPWIYLKTSENWINLLQTVMEIFTDNFQGSKLKSFKFRTTGYVQYKPINIVMYAEIEYSRNHRYSLILHRCYSRKL